jgi:hypothetical protein
MTDTAKPTTGPVRFTEVKSNWPAEGYKEGGWHEALWSDGANQPIMVALDQDDHAARFDFPNPKDMDFIQEAYAVYTKTGLTPRQLLEQRNELRDALFALQMAFIKINGCFPLPYSSGHQEMTQAQSALAKCGKVGVK